MHTPCCGKQPPVEQIKPARPFRVSEEMWLVPLISDKACHVAAARVYTPVCAQPSTAAAPAASALHHLRACCSRRSLVTRLSSSVSPRARIGTRCQVRDHGATRVSLSGGRDRRTAPGGANSCQLGPCERGVATKLRAGRGCRNSGRSSPAPNAQAHRRRRVICAARAARAHHSPPVLCTLGGRACGGAPGATLRPPVRAVGSDPVYTAAAPRG